jgi:transposase-like protein
MAKSARETWAKRVERWKDSGLTANEFAAEMGFNANTLSHWSWKLSQEKSASPATAPKRRRSKKPRPRRSKPRRKRTAKPEPVAFIDVSPVVSGGRNQRFEIELGSRRLFVPPQFEAEALTRLLDVLEARS